MKTKFLISIATLFLVGFVFSTNAAADSYVKKSVNSYCHYKTSDFYDRTRRFEKFPTLASCLDSGGRMPPTSESNKEPEVKFSRTRLCHDKNSAHYVQTKNFVAFESMEDCIKHGGSQ